MGGNSPLKASEEKEIHLFRFRKLPRGLDQRGQRSQRFSGLEEGMLWMVSRKNIVLIRRVWVLT